MSKIGRREFLRISAVSAAGVVVAACQPQTVVVKETVEVEKEKVVKETVVVEKEKVVKETVVVEKEKVVEPTAVPQVQEAPQLNDLVATGALAPLAERLPSDPLLITPWQEVGKYGGTWHRFDTSKDGSHLVQDMYGHSPLHWVKDGLDRRGGLCSSWESSEDKSEWTLFLRKGVKWSDGQPVTVDDILFWWHDMAENPEANEFIEGYMIVQGERAVLEKVDDFTLKLKWNGPNALIADGLCKDPKGVRSGKFIRPKHYMTQFHPTYTKSNPDFKLFLEKNDWRINPECPVLNAWMPVEGEVGVRLALERNPFYYGTDTAGNQLPYIDKVDVSYVENAEVVKLKVISGEMEIGFKAVTQLPLSNVSLFRASEMQAGFHTELWDGGGGSASAIFFNLNHLDPDKNAVYRNPIFRRAMSHAMDRVKIQKMVFYGLGEPTTGCYSPKAIEWNRTDRGKELYIQSRDLAVTYDPEKAKQMLDEIGVVDQNGDGWRELPGGKPLELRFDISATAAKDHYDVVEIIKEGWEAVGCKTIVASAPSEQISALQKSAQFDVYAGMDMGDGPNHLLYAGWLLPTNSWRFSPLYGAWYSVKGTPKEGTELDKDPVDRDPPRDEPPADSFEARMQALYDQAITEPDDIKRDNLVLDIVQISIDEGPFWLGTVGNSPRMVTFSNTVGNVPTREQLGQGGFVNPGAMVYFGIIYPEVLYYKS